MVVRPFSKLNDTQRQFIRQHKPELIAALTGKPATPDPAIQTAERDTLTREELEAIQAANIRLDVVLTAIKARERAERIALEFQFDGPEPGDAEVEERSQTCPPMQPIKLLVAAAVDALEQRFHQGKSEDSRSHAERLRERIDAGLVSDDGEWITRMEWKARETEQEAREAAPPPKPYPEPNRAATGSTGGGHVACGSCSNFVANRFGAGGIGRCKLIENPPGGLLYPRIERRCASFAPGNGSTSKAAVLDAAHDNIIPTSTPTTATLETQP